MGRLRSAATRTERFPSTGLAQKIKKTTETTAARKNRAEHEETLRAIAYPFAG